MAALVTTVSKTYAREITDPYFAHGLDGIIRDNAFKLTGIINGIDPADNDPKTDKGLSFNYGPGDHLSLKQMVFQDLVRQCLSHCFLLCEQ